MILLLHITVAVTSLAFSTFMYFNPSKRKLQASYALAAATLASGTYLVLSTGSHILQACIMGLVYFAAVLILTALARRKLSAGSH